MKITGKKLTVRKESLRSLSAEEMGGAGGAGRFGIGAGSQGVWACYNALNGSGEGWLPEAAPIVIINVNQQLVR
jgi:hypothetical protein